MDSQLALLVDASIQLELNVAELYAVFQDAFPEHSDFWWKLRIEERNHAALIRTAKEQFDPVGKFPADLISTKLQELTECNAKISAATEEFRTTPPTEAEAFSIALVLEQSAGETHYQKFMEADTSSNATLLKVFQKLNEHDKDHAERICNYMIERGIDLVEVSL